jgi:hypothetical protein
MDTEGLTRCVDGRRGVSVEVRGASSATVSWRRGEPQACGIVMS